MPNSPYFGVDELKSLGFASVGDEPRISRKCSLYAISGSIGSNVRIDDFCIFKGHVEIGSYVHVAAFCSVSGAYAKVELKDFCTLSNRVSIFSGSDDYAADTLNNSQVPEEFTTVRKGPVSIGQAVLVGAHSVILPGVTIGDGGSVGARDVGKIMAMAKEFLARVKRR